MGQVFEELLRRFSEMSNETSGEHYTPRDVVRLLVSLLFAEHREDLRGQGIIRSIFDPCCGTGGMLTIGKAYFREQINPDADIRLLGQELNAQTYAICKSDMLITGEDPDNIRHGSSLSEDQFQGQRFDYMITNPPFGVSWKSDEELVKAEARTAYGRFSAGTPRAKVTVERPLIEKQEILGAETEGIVRDKKGNPKPDPKLRDYARVPLTENIEDYYQREVEPHVPECWIDRKKDKVGYEINFNRYFYQYTPLRSLIEITDELLALERKSEGLLNAVLDL